MGYIVIGLVIGGGIVSCWFIYQYLYTTLDEANSIVVLKSAPDIDEVNMDLYTKTKSLIDFKRSTSTLALPKRNIFTFVSSSPPTSSLSRDITQ